MPWPVIAIWMVCKRTWMEHWLYTELASVFLCLYFCVLQWFKPKALQFQSICSITEPALKDTFKLLSAIIIISYVSY